MPAQIIAFPCPKARAAQAESGTPSPPDGQARLQQALARLDAPMMEQREAVAGWRQALAGLQTSMRTLDSNMQRYRGLLDGLQTGVTGLNVQAKSLERWADGALLSADRAR